MGESKYPEHSGKKFIVQLIMDKDFRQKVAADKENMINSTDMDQDFKDKLKNMDINALGSTPVDEVDSYLNDNDIPDGCW